jgi:hypothetical protein
MLNPSDNPPEKPDRLLPLKKLIDRHPLAFWGGLWAALVLTGSVATVGLLSPGPIEKEITKQTPALSQVRESTTRKDLPLSLFGGILLGCAAGSLLVTQALRYTTQPRTPKRLGSSATARRRRRNAAKKRQAVSSPLQRVETKPISQTPSHQQTQISVLPPEEKLSLDGEQDNLAELMDLRKHQSLASLMRGQ